MKRTRITVVLAATGGGAQKSSLTTAQGLQDSGYEVTVVMPSARGPFMSLLSGDVRVVDLGTRNPLRVLQKLARYVTAEAADVILANQQHINTAAVLARRIARSRVPLALVQRNDLSAFAQLSSNPLVRSQPAMARFLWDRADAVVACSEGVRDDLIRNIHLNPQKVHLIHNPVVAPNLPALAAEPVQHRWFEPGSPPVILGVGNLIPQKDFATLIRAVAVVRKRMDCKLLILGEGNDRIALQALIDQLGISNECELHGFVPNPYAFMARCGLFALSSRFEGLSRVLIEALACGAPCVATDCPSSPREILEDGRYGRIVPMGDHEALAAAMLSTLASPGDRDERKQRAADFTVERSLERYIELIERLTATAR